MASLDERLFVPSVCRFRPSMSGVFIDCFSARRLDDRCTFSLFGLETVMVSIPNPFSISILVLTARSIDANSFFYFICRHSKVPRIFLQFYMNITGKRLPFFIFTGISFIEFSTTLFSPERVNQLWLIS